ncbi:MAG: aminotransferase class III-fold pyridoxal phosphate-dependent enzyme [Actinomycetes bacterium]
MTSLWHPFADMAVVERDGPFVLTRGEAQFVDDESGRRYLDMTAGLWFANVGHGRREIADAVGAQAAQLAHFSGFGDMTEQPTIDLAERIAAIAPVAGSKVFFTSGGSDAVDTAKKLVRRYWNLVGEPGRRVTITRDRAYHGMHWGGTSLSGIDVNKDGYGDLQPDIVRVAWDDATALAETIDALGPENVAAFFCEPVIGAGGVHFAGEEYLHRARQVCADRGVLWVSDEVITGFGRTGEWFASTRFELNPDLMLTAKGLTSGYVPMGAVVVSPRVADPFFTSPGVVWRHGYTYSGHAVAAAAALANLDIIEREGLVDRVRSLETTVTSALSPLADHPAVSEVRSGLGLLAAVQLAPDVLERDPGAAAGVVSGLRQRGVLSRALVGGSLQVSPPFVIDEADLKTFVEATWAALPA